MRQHRFHRDRRSGTFAQRGYTPLMWIKNCSFDPGGTEIHFTLSQLVLVPTGTKFNIRTGGTVSGEMTMDSYASFNLEISGAKTSGTWGVGSAIEIPPYDPQIRGCSGEFLGPGWFAPETI